MQPSQQTRISVEFLDWINTELRKEIERQEEKERQEQGFVDRVKTYIVAGLTSAILLAMGLLN
jgi:hypothetical protein